MRLIVCLVALWVCTASAVDMKIVTASERGTYIVLGRDLAKFVAPDADIQLEVLPSAGSVENVRRLRHEAGVKFALVQSDVFQGYMDQAAQGNREAGQMIRPLRVVLPLYNEEIYFIVRADSPINYVHEIRGAKINAGALGSGTALTTTTLYRLMFGAPIPEWNVSFLSNEDALVKLIGDKSVDVVAVVAGQPAKLLADMKPEAKEVIRLLKFDANHAASKTALKTYVPATVRATSYPNLLTDDVPSLAVKAYLVTYDYNLQHTQASLTAFARSLCKHFPALQAGGHPKWKEVELAQPVLGQGWLYYPPMAREIRACSGERVRPAKPAGKTCSQHERILGLCE